jgi:hypothetical protein
MKQLICLTSILIVLSSCSSLNSINSLVNKSDIKYKVEYSNDLTYVASVPFLSKSKLDERQRVIREFDDLLIKSYSTVLSDEERNKYSILYREQYQPIVFDSTGFIKVSFDERLIDNSAKLEYIYFWDYSNIRFLVPFLSFGNEIHKINQCVNKAIEVCYKNHMNSVVIAPTLNHFKLYKSK